MNSLKKGEGVPLLNSERAPGVQLLNSGGDGGGTGEGFRGPCPTFTPCHKNFLHKMLKMQKFCIW